MTSFHVTSFHGLVFMQTRSYINITVLLCTYRHINSFNLFDAQIQFNQEQLSYEKREKYGDEKPNRIAILSHLANYNGVINI